MTSKHIFTKLQNKIRSWHPGDYVRQLSTVVLGILITFAGSDMIGKISARKQLRQSMRMVLTELEANQQTLKDIQEMASMEYRVTKYFSEHLKEFSSIPSDTLQRYQNFFTSSQSFNFSKNAIETLKISGIVQHETSPELLNELFTCYDDLQVIERIVETYHCSKMERMEAFAAGLTLSQVLRIREGDTECFWSLFLGNDHMRNLSLNTGYTEGLVKGNLTVSETVSATIEMLRRKYKL